MKLFWQIFYGKKIPAKKIKQKVLKKFDGTKNISLKIPVTIKADLNGNATTSTKVLQDAAGNVITEKYMLKISTAAFQISRQ